MKFFRYLGLTLFIAISARSGVAQESNGFPPLGSGNPGLKIAEYEHHFVVFSDQRDCGGLDFRSGGWRDRHIEPIYDSATQTIGGTTFDPGEHFPADWNCHPLFPFDHESAFFVKEVPEWVEGRMVGYRSSTNLVRWKSAAIEVLDVDVYAQARRRYGLTGTENFLGSLDSNVFFTKSGEMDRIYWYAKDNMGESHSVLVSRHVIAFYGVTRGLQKAFCLIAIAKSEGAFPYSPNEGVVLDLNL